MTDDERWERREARWERMDAAREIRMNKAFDELQEYMAQATKILAGLARSVNEMGEAVKETGRDVREHRIAFEVESREQRAAFAEESRAHRAALWAMIDRLNGGSGPEPA